MVAVPAYAFDLIFENKNLRARWITMTYSQGEFYHPGVGDRYVVPFAPHSTASARIG